MRKPSSKIKEDIARLQEQLKAAEAREAERIGLVNASIPKEKLMDEAIAMAKRIAENDLFSLKMIKKGLGLAQAEVSLEALMDFEIEACLACVSTRTRRAALDQFEKRKQKE